MSEASVLAPGRPSLFPDHPSIRAGRPIERSMKHNCHAPGTNQPSLLRLLFAGHCSSLLLIALPDVIHIGIIAFNLIRSLQSEGQIVT